MGDPIIVWPPGCGNDVDCATAFGYGAYDCSDPDPGPRPWRDCLLLHVAVGWGRRKSPLFSIDFKIQGESVVQKRLVSLLFCAVSFGQVVPRPAPAWNPLLECKGKTTLLAFVVTICSHCKAFTREVMEPMSKRGEVCAIAVAFDEGGDTGKIRPRPRVDLHGLQDGACQGPGIPGDHGPGSGHRDSTSGCDRQTRNDPGAKRSAGDAAAESTGRDPADRGEAEMTEMQALVRFILRSAENHAWDNAASGLLNSMELEGPNEAAINVFYRPPAGSQPNHGGKQEAESFLPNTIRTKTFRSTIVAGQIRQHLYVPAPTPESGDLFIWQRSDGKAGRIRLVLGPMEVYLPGDSWLKLRHRRSIASKQNREP